MFCSQEFVLAIQLITVVKTSWVPASVNLALNKPARQSTTETGNAQLVVNGVYSDFSETATEQSNWWMVDLLRTYSIGQIKVHGRKDCCANQLLEVTVLTTGELRPPDPVLGTVSWVTRHQQRRSIKELRIISFPFPVVVQHVAVHRRNNRSLALSEVEVFDFPADNNLARGKTAQQNGGNRPASLAVNGIYNDFTLTANTLSWWKVDLGALHRMLLVILYNRLDCCQGNLYRFAVKYTTLAENTTPTSGWEILLNYGLTFQRKKVAVGTKLFHARQIGVVAGGIRTLSLAEVEVFAPRNLAFQKKASQLPINPNVDSSNAVNAIYSDFAEIVAPNEKRWTVDLEDVYVVNDISVNYHNKHSIGLRGIEIFTSKQQNTFDLLLETSEYRRTHAQWNAANKVDPREVRHVLVQTARANVTLQLTEVVVTEFDYAYRKEASQSSVCEDKEAGYEPCSAARAVDNDLSTFSKPNKADQSAQWWKVSLGKVVKFRLATIFGNSTERCLDSDFNEYICSDRIGKLSIFTSLGNVSTLCYYGHDDFEKVFIVQCNRNRHQPIMEQFQINMNITKDIHNLELAQVEVFAKELPQLTVTRQVEVTKGSLLPNEYHLEFLKWTHRDKGCIPPHKYIISLEGNVTKTVDHDGNKGTDRISVKFADLERGQTYNGTIKCEIDSFSSPGCKINFQLSTEPCTKPDPVHFSIEVTPAADNSTRSRDVMINIQQVRNHNCKELQGYQLLIQTRKGVQVFLENMKSHGEVTVPDLEVEVNYSVQVSVRNNQGLLTKKEKVIYIAGAETASSSTITASVSESKATIGDVIKSTTTKEESSLIPAWIIALIAIGAAVSAICTIMVIYAQKKIEEEIKDLPQDVEPQILWEPSQSSS